MVLWESRFAASDQADKMALGINRREARPPQFNKA
jgi:hypothetical protein